jgi:hypothetical protein
VLPTKYGRLGVLDLKKFAHALRLRWLWLEWKDSDKPWVGMPIPCNEKDCHFLVENTTITVGNGTTARF